MSFLSFATTDKRDVVDGDVDECDADDTAVDGTVSTDLKQDQQENMCMVENENEVTAIKLAPKSEMEI